MNGGRSASHALHARARGFVRAFEAGAAMPEPFDALACDLARHQAANVEGYARLCAARGIDPKSLVRASDAPAVPTDAFKVARVAAFPPDEAAITFRTSGTTIGDRGAHAMRDVATYDAAALAFGRACLVRLVGLARATPARFPILVIGPPPEEVPDSSLGHMLTLFANEWGEPAPSEHTYFIRDGVIDLASLSERVAQLDATPALVLGTSFAFVHLLDALDDAAFELPRASRLMQTGGFKGRSREVSADALRQSLARTFAIADADIVAEYGMTELSSQFYDAQPRAGVFVEPPWARVVPVDPVSLAPVADGEIGIARIEDLMNVDSAFAVLAADRVRRVDGGFELLGRAPGAAPRGCSIAIDEMLGG